MMDLHHGSADADHIALDIMSSMMDLRATNGPKSNKVLLIVRLTLTAIKYYKLRSTFACDQT